MGQAAAIRVGWRSMVADVVHAAHVAVTALFTVAWALPWRWSWWLAALGAPTLHAQWCLNGDLCVLTSIERRLRGLSPTPAATERGFLGDLAERAAGHRPNEARVNALAYAVLWGGAAAACVRLTIG
jgi:hypothetical protein